jgi:hypothetical protein
MLQDHVTRLENIVRWHWSAGDVVIWDNRATQHRAIDDYGKEPRIVRRVTIDGPVSVGIDGRHGKKRDSDAQAAAAAGKITISYEVYLLRNGRLCPEAGVATLRLGTSAVDITSDVPVTESDWPPMTHSRPYVAS